MKKFLDSSHLHSLKSHADKLLKKTLNRHVKLAVTGLSRSGKSAFITSFVYQLTEQATSQNLPFVAVITEQRFIGSKKVPQKSLHVPSFALQEALDNLFASEPRWPDSTRSISELRIAIRYRPQAGLLSHFSELNTLYVDVVDYPGEWLMDLPMLSLDYAKWSQMMAQLFNAEPRQTPAAKFIRQAKALDLYGPVDESLLSHLSREYSQLLIHFKNNLGLSLLQPGRFILPGELDGAPILQFIPLFNQLDGIDWENIEPGSNLAALVGRFDEYKQRVVKGFYNDYFRHFDRQVVLVDCLTPLNAGRESFEELQRALTLILQSYHYGKNDLLHRIFSPRIDKLLFAATKVDHITIDQHKNLTILLDRLIASARKTIQYEGIKVETLSMSSIKATDNGFVTHQGIEHPCITGRTLTSASPLTLYPGEVPKELPDSQFWRNDQFNFVAFAPPVCDEKKLAHIRMDHVIEYLIGDKLS